MATTMTQGEIQFLVSDGTFMLSTIIQLLVESVCFGLYILIFSYAFYLLISKPEKSRPSRIRLGLIISLFSMSTTLFILERFIFFWQTHRVMLSSGSEPYSDRVNSAYSTVTPISYAAQWLFSCEFLIGDGIVIQRTWVLWQGSLAVYFPILLWVTSLAVLIAERVLALFGDAGTPTLIQAPDVSDGVPSLGAASYALSVATNAASTFLIALKAWEYRQIIRQSLGKKASSIVSRVLALLVESGLMYLCFWGVYIITNVGASSTTDLGSLSRFIQVLAGIGDHMVGIYPTIIIALVERQCSVHDFSVATASISFPSSSDPESGDGEGIELREFQPGVDSGSSGERDAHQRGNSSQTTL